MTDFLFSSSMLPVWAAVWIGLAVFIHWFDGKYAPWRSDD